eukprot:scaffold92819_cov22-Tisochrysis_lutea.AAC.2
MQIIHSESALFADACHFSGQLCALPCNIHACRSFIPSLHFSQVLITLLGSCALFRTMPPSGVLESFARSLGARLHTCNAADLSSALAALARLRFLPVSQTGANFHAGLMVRHGLVAWLTRCVGCT